MVWRKQDQRSPEAFTERSLAEDYLGPLNKLIHAAPTMRVLPPRAAERHILDLASGKKISLAVMERLMGMVRVIELGQDAVLWNTAIASRRRRELLQKAGLSMDDGADEVASELDLLAVLLALAARWTTTDNREHAPGGHPR